MPTFEKQPAANEPFVRDLRNRLNALLADVLAAVEEDGAVSDDGLPHPCLPALIALAEAGTNVRHLSVRRKALSLEIGRRA